MKTKSLLWLTSTAALLGAFGLSALADSTKPNIIFMLADGPGEAHDLASAQPDKVKELQKLWDKWNARNVPALWTGDSREDKTPVPPPQKQLKERTRP